MIGRSNSWDWPPAWSTRVGYRETTCILLPAVCKFNAKVNGEKQAILKKGLCDENVVRDVLKVVGSDEDKADLGDV
jgi:hypothetical protein